MRSAFVSNILFASLLNFSLLKVKDETIKNSKYHQLILNRMYYIATLSKSLEGQEIVYSLYKSSKNELEMFVISCTNM